MESKLAKPVKFITGVNDSFQRPAEVSIPKLLFSVRAVELHDGDLVPLRASGDAKKDSEPID